MPDPKSTAYTLAHIATLTKPADFVDAFPLILDPPQLAAMQEWFQDAADRMHFWKLAVEAGHPCVGGSDA